ncbi:bacteriochlorophyll 4-vinyl reductase [Erythrobacter sp. HL-111]|uniref:bacteriochlorophyll 4-vinyl reductase n=1 Tax=Erythrobacter sp. HL-111 TaxID=1798193 RepID=UPI0006D9B7F0|nr:bacteriochlorophyll 4-vinyl reductase [Erythrobacter sp. HL-111]KPP92903.1 MAG: divinyl protochlorophyllide a 8-vinyl-reductase BchJ [Erythrobacteraceae bacterium HL-111]SDT01050.1 divinyl protochlorophyllide a 8-vinyl-reductase [Erythrobacter sp. HL-111]
MREAAAAPPGEAEIGPNAVLQTMRVIETRLGAGAGAAILAEAGLARLPDGTGMIREADAIALHRAIARRFPHEAEAIARASGAATADYIIAHRIPAPAKALLRLLPAALAAPLLMAAIRQHAWTFVGAGRFTPAGGWAFTIDRAAARDDPAPPPSLFTWYGAVFTRLFRKLVSARAECRVVACERDGLARRYRIGRAGRAFPAPFAVSRRGRPDESGMTAP